MSNVAMEVRAVIRDRDHQLRTDLGVPSSFKGDPRNLVHPNNLAESVKDRGRGVDLKLRGSRDEFSRVGELSLWVSLREWSRFFLIIGEVRHSGAVSRTSARKRPRHRISAACF